MRAVAKVSYRMWTAKFLLELSNCLKVLKMIATYPSWTLQVMFLPMSTTVSATHAWTSSERCWSWCGLPSFYQWHTAHRTSAGQTLGKAALQDQK